MKLFSLFEEAARRGASDIHLAIGEVPRLRIDGALAPLGEPLDIPAVLEPFLTSEATARLGAGLPFERTLVHGNLAFVGIAFRVGDGGLAATFRLLRRQIPSLEVIAEDALPFFRKIVEARKGLVLIVGLTGSGKATTVTSIADAINLERAARIFVVEAHQNLLFESKQSMVTQLHVGQDCESYDRALEIAVQADVDVVTLDDLPTLETLRQALVLAATGHLVIANLHATTVAEAIDRLLESAGPDAGALRRALSENLLAVTAQRLLPGIERGRAPAYEWIFSTPTIRRALLEGDVRATQATDPECRTLEAALDELVASGRVSAETAERHRG